MSAKNEWTSAEKLAEKTGNTKQVIYSECRAGMPHSRRGRRILVRLSDYNKWIERHVVDPDSQDKD